MGSDIFPLGSEGKVIQIILREITERLKGSSMPRIFSLLLFIFFSL